MNESREQRIYKEIRSLTREEVDEMLARADPAELRYLAISVSMFSDDFDWAQRVCSILAKHGNSTVRGNAVLSFGHLARRFRKLDLNVVEPIYRAALRDADEFVRSQAQDMVDDIIYYLAIKHQWPTEN